ncbi:CmcJ/NvfI family oxidoreductase [Herbaspirillum robiniae]|uniref:Methyltransferase n=1 Tax=Herbaspirillum robiniae TaxID=2014887 RepID=A0ABX2LSH3_9BURK|nr:CmcJ/NvfI family oxidoreductase [Herbaspirillum robiniae]NUU01502.1 methyltransferase [Herbaspirillum robiniae]
MPAQAIHAVHQAQPAGVTAALSYLADQAVLPVSYAYPPPPGQAWESASYEARSCFIADARGEPGHALDGNGFLLADAPTAVRDFGDEGEIVSAYYAEAVELALLATGGTHAYVFDHLVRRREADRAALSFGRKAPGGLPAANGRIHNDYTEQSGRRRLALLLRDSDLLPFVQHFSIINIWRSINGPVQDTPLAVCDARSVRPEELVRGEVRYPKRTGEIYQLRHAGHHRWSYFSRMDRHEALLFKQYDSRTQGVARFTPHAAFDLPQIPPGAPLRQSIELRCLVVHA